MEAGISRPRVAIVTGGGTGIGGGIVEVLSADGIDCVIAGRREQPLLDTAEALAGAPGAIHVVVGDVTSESGREAIVAGAVERFGALDILVNNAGGGNNSPLLEYTPSMWREVLAQNLESTFFLSQLAVPHLRSSRAGRIVNIASIVGSLASDDTMFADIPTTGDRGPVRAPSYGAAKAGVINVGRELAVALAPWNITVNTVSPGFIERPERPRASAFLDRIAARTPLGRAGEPRDIGHAVRFLASEEAGYVTGANLVVDGGWSIW